MNSKTALITGVSSGIGRGLALALGERGYRVIVSDTSVDEVDAIVREVEEKGGTAVPRCCDATRSENVQLLANMVVAQFGVPDLVFNNVGSTVCKPVFDYTREDWRQLFDTNLFAAWDTARRFANEAIAAKRECRIVFSASEHCFGYTPPGLAAYAASMNALLSLAESFRTELAGRIAVSVVCPGFTHSHLWGDGHRMPAHTAKEAESGQMIMREGCDPVEIGRVAVDGVERGEFIIVTHPESRHYATHRYNEVDAAFHVLDKESRSA
ncbi:SDR family NAD(P)-dependent oxidoreductase [Burkholderia stagnalis]